MNSPYSLPLTDFQEIVACFTTEKEALGKPLTYLHNKANSQLPGTPHEKVGPQRETAMEAIAEVPEMPLPQKSVRQNTIELKTPGLGQGDGFIHTTLCRLPLDCLSSTDVELDQIHRLCREATATLVGHRMMVRKFRFLETQGKGGESNPCVDPIFDETVEAPPKIVQRSTSGETQGSGGANNNTIGANLEFPPRRENTVGLFDVPES